MQTKQWKGRKRPKLIEADPMSEVKLAELIAERQETSDEEEENDNSEKDDASTVKKFTTISISSADSHFVWGEVPPREEVKSQSTQEKEESACVWKAGVIMRSKVDPLQKVQSRPSPARRGKAIKVNYLWIPRSFTSLTI